MAEYQDHAIYPGAELFLIHEFMQTQDISARQWLLGVGLTEAQVFDPDTRVSLRQFDIIYRNIYRLAPQQDLGLTFGAALNLSRWGMLSGALLTSRTLGQALATANEMRSLVRSRFNLATNVVGELCHIEVSTHDAQEFPLSLRFAYEVLAASLQTQIRDLLSEDIHFEAVSFAFPAPTYADQYRLLLQCPVHFSAPKTRLTIKLDTLKRPLPLANPVARKQVLHVCRIEAERLARVLQGDIVWQVRELFARHDDTRVTLEQAAQALKVSARTLRRKLELANHSFKCLQEEHSLQLALRLLQQGDLTVNDIAMRCGYQDIASFRAAFKRWTGMLPTQHRASYLSISADQM
ncbi:AraC family transcriptional regulator [Thalassolituus oleivorans]|uniref:AraC family transcriptional regulator n=1 Tax=Thalassolituus oleivorans TaxID=187493 RepID=UPI0023EFDB0C|nr:AraC family transcriptional regulator [Thalassolituus oleivorans]